MGNGDGNSEGGEAKPRTEDEEITERFCVLTSVNIHIKILWKVEQ
jgi:hypothetical protein